MGKATDDSLEQILNQFREDARSNRDLGDRLKRMMQKFFRVDPLHAELFSEAWMWKDWPLKVQMGASAKVSTENLQTETT